MNSLEYIEDYFKGLLTAAQKEEFEQRILSDPSFAEELAFYLNAQALLKDSEVVHIGIYGVDGAVLLFEVAAEPPARYVEAALRMQRRHIGHRLG